MNVATQGDGPAWRRRALGYGLTIRDFANQAFIRPGDPLHPYAEAVARAPLAIGEAVEGSLGDAVSSIDTASTRLGQQLGEIRVLLGEVVPAARAQALAAQAETAAEIAKTVGQGLDEAVRQDRRIRRWHAQIQACLAVTAVFVAGLIIGFVYADGRAEVRLVRDRADQLAEVNRAVDTMKVTFDEMRDMARGDVQEAIRRLTADTQTAATASREAAAFARTTTTATLELQNSLAGLRGLTNEQLAQLTLVGANAPRTNPKWTGFEHERVPWPCFAAGPRAILEKGGRDIPTCLVALPDTTRVSGRALQNWVTGINARGWEASFAQ